MLCALNFGESLMARVILRLILDSTISYFTVLPAFDLRALKSISFLLFDFRALGLDSDGWPNGWLFPPSVIDLLEKTPSGTCYGCGKSEKSLCSITMASIGHIGFTISVFLLITSGLGIGMGMCFYERCVWSLFSRGVESPVTEFIWDRLDFKLRLWTDLGVTSLETLTECFRDFKEIPPTGGKGGHALSWAKVDFLLLAGSIW